MLPLLQGNAFTPRKWIYNWYSRGGQLDDASVFARTQRYKLYDDGRFFEIPKDYLEENPIAKSKLNYKTLEIYNMLDDVLKTNATKRLELINKEE